MAITSVGYDGSVDEVQWARLAAHLGTDYWVEGPGAWKVTAVTAADRTVRIAAGVGGGKGVRDESDAAVTVQAGVVASGSRWDLVVARRNWQPPAGETTFAIVQGTSTKQIPAGRLTNPGVEDDQPLALVRFTAGQQLATEIIDLRCWHGPGGLVAAREEALEYLGTPGAVVWVGSQPWVRGVTAQGTATWVQLNISAAQVVSGVLPIARGGTGAATAAAARDALGVPSRSHTHGRGDIEGINDHTGDGATGNPVGITPTGLLYRYAASANNATPRTIVVRDASGRITANTPTAAAHVATKSYVDQAIANALG